MAQEMTFYEFEYGVRTRQYVQIDGRAQTREVRKPYADNLGTGWTILHSMNADIAERHVSDGWRLVGTFTAPLTVNEYDDLWRVPGIPSTVKGAIRAARERFAAEETAKRNLDKDLPVDPLVKATKTFGGVRKYQIPLDFIHEGTLFTVTRKHEVIDAVAHMDGHSVSPMYGRVNGAAHYIGNDNPDNYINVRFVGRHYSAGGPGVNEGLAVKKGDKVWVSEADYNRYVKDHAALVERTESAKTVVKRLNVQQKINAARKMLEEAESELAAIS